MLSRGWGGYVLSVIVSGVSTAKGDACLLCSAETGRWSGVLSSVFRTVYVSFTVSLYYMTVCSGLYVIVVTYRFCLAGAKRRLVTIKLWIQVGTINSNVMFMCCLVFGYEYYIHYMSVQ